MRFIALSEIVLATFLLIYSLARLLYIWGHVFVFNTGVWLVL